MNIKLETFKSKSLFERFGFIILTKNIYSAPKKSFEIPLDAWLSNNLSSMVQDIFLRRQIQLLTTFLKKITINSLPLSTKNIDTHPMV